MLENNLNTLENISNNKKESSTTNTKKKKNSKNKMFTQTKALKVASIIIRTMHDVTKEQ